MCFTGSADKTIRKWDIFSGKCKSIYEGHEAIIQSVLVHHNYLFSSSYDKTARNWNLRTGECLQVYSGHTRAVSPLLFVNLSVADKRTERRKSRVNIERRLSTVSRQSQEHKSLLITGVTGRCLGVCGVWCVVCVVYVVCVVCDLYVVCVAHVQHVAHVGHVVDVVSMAHVVCSVM